jgi:predicted nucleic acid-binding protein
VIVVDASALVELLLGSPRGALVAARLAAPGETIHCPHLMDLEVVSALRTLETRGGITSTDAANAVTALLTAPIHRYPHDPLVPRIWRLRGNVTPYDAAYVALAEHLQAPVVTCDAQLARVPGLRVAFQVF